MFPETRAPWLRLCTAWADYRLALAESKVVKYTIRLQALRNK